MKKTTAFTAGTNAPRKNREAAIEELKHHAVLDVGSGIWTILVPLSPVPAARPRVGRRGTYYPQNYQRWMKQADDALRPLVRVSSPAGERGLHVHIQHVVRKPKTGKLSTPRGDTDNYIKATLDALTRAQLIWLDDTQVLSVYGEKRYAAPDELAYTYIRAGLDLHAVHLCSSKDCPALPDRNPRMPADLLRRLKPL